MASEQINRCPLCKCIVSLEMHGRTNKIKSLGGISIGDLKHSAGGWGHSKHILRSFSDEVCNECYTHLRIKMDELADTFNELRGSKENETINIEKTFEKSTTIFRMHKRKPWYLRILNWWNHD